MQIDLKVKNIVLVGSFNVSLFDKYFFIKNQIIDETDLQPNSFLSMGNFGAQVVNRKFNIVISANQIVVTSLVPEDNDEINKVTSDIIRAANVNSIDAMGINFSWFLTDHEKSLEQLSRENFYGKEIKIFSKIFDKPDSLFGVYVSTDFMNARLKLDIKPSKMELVLNSNAVQDLINFAFNFHFVIKKRNINTEVLKNLEDYDSYKKESERVISIYK